VAEIIKAKKEDLGLPARGRISVEDRQRLDSAVEKEMKKEKIFPPKA
jgi:hypothetical protein